MPKKRKRHYGCKLPVNSRFLFCGHKKAGSWCLKGGIYGDKCPKLAISYR